MYQKKYVLIVYLDFIFYCKLMKKRFGIIKNAYMWLIIWLMLVIWSWLIFILNVNFSSEFTWWVNLSINKNVDINKISKDMKRYLEQNWFKNPKIEVENITNWASITIETKVNDDKKVNSLSNWLKKFLMEDNYIKTSDDVLSLSITWPSVWAYMQKATLIALWVWLLFMAIYMLFSFAAIRKYISPSILAVVTIITMFFDISIPTWMYWLRMMINHTVQVDTIFVIAILTTMWYSINDTIIIFDRIRENIQKTHNTNWMIYWKVFENSLWQTMRRSIWTSVSTLLVIVAMFILWTWVLKSFAFTMWIWVIAWTYSSIFIAAPLAYLMLWKFKKERKKL